MTAKQKWTRSTRFAFISCAVMIAVCISWYFTNPTDESMLTYRELWDKPTKDRYLTRYNSGKVEARYLLRVMTTKFCVSIVNDEREVMEGFVELPENVFHFQIVEHDKYRLQQISNSRLAAVIIQKPYAFKLVCCNCSDGLEE